MDQPPRLYLWASLLRFLVVGLFLAGSLGLRLWVSVSFRAEALLLDAARHELERSKIEHDRLLIQREMLLSPARLDAVARGVETRPPDLGDLAGRDREQEK